MIGGVLDNVVAVVVGKNELAIVDLMEETRNKWYFTYATTQHYGQNIVRVSPTQTIGTHEILINIDIPEITRRDSQVIAGIIVSIIAYNHKDVCVVSDDNTCISDQACLYNIDLHLFKIFNTSRWVYHNAVEQLLKRPQPFGKLVMPTKHDRDGDVMMWS